MDIKILVKMANQIETFFRSQDEDGNAIAEGVRNHIERSWDPRMRQQIKGYVEAGGEGLGEFAIEAVKRLQPLSPQWGGSKVA
ncbi:MAG TPA: formate dehydrogenase subunit delta [Burkholderiales bacterium]|nr:formate dehydrogenase subunit delta [Burkholderiales bacterium]